MRNKKLVGTEINGLKVTNYYSSSGKQFFECFCVCGKLFQARVDAIKAGSTKSCGCLTGNLISQKNRLPNNVAMINLVNRTYKDNAAKRNIEFSLSLDEFKKLISMSCKYCGQEPQQAKFAGHENRRDRFLTYNGIDRVDNNIGYIFSNCVPCCTICNAAKSDLSFEEFKSWIQRLVSHNGN